MFVVSAASRGKPRMDSQSWKTMDDLAFLFRAFSHLDFRLFAAANGARFAQLEAGESCLDRAKVVDRFH